MNKQQLKQKARMLYDSGNSRQEIFNKLSLEFDNKKKIARIVKNQPIKERVDKYGFINTVFIGFIILTTLISSYFLSFIHIWILILGIIVFIKSYRFYYLISIVGLVLFLLIIVVTYSGYFEPIHPERTMTIWSNKLLLLASIIFILFGSIYPRIIIPNYSKKIDKERNTIDYIFK
jgi:hypothetical protein